MRGAIFSSARIRCEALTALPRPLAGLKGWASREKEDKGRKRGKGIRWKGKKRRGGKRKKGEEGVKGKVERRKSFAH